MPSYSCPYTRHVKQGKSDLISCTAIATMTSQAHRRMVAAPWRRVEPVVSDLPPHNFLQSGFSDAYDASAYCGDYAEGRQIAYATAACYTVTVPGDALSGTVANITSIALAVAGDRWLSGGCIVSAILTTSAAPPSWADVLAATISTPNPVTSADDIDPTWQAPCRKITRSNTGNDSRSTIYLQVAAAAQQYLHIIVRLGDYDSASYLAWVEGGVLIDGGTISVEFDRAVIADPTPAAYAPVRLAVQQTGPSRRVTFSGVNHNLQSGYLQLQWGARMLLAGFVDPVSDIATNTATLDSDQRLAPRVTIAGTTSTAKGELVEAYCAEPLVAGYALWIQCGETPEGTGRIRISVLASDAVPDVTSGAMWDGTAADVIGTALVHPAAGEWVGVPIAKNAPTRKLQIVAAVAEISVADAAAIAVGFANTGLRLADMHVAQTPAVAAAAAVPATGIMVLHPDALSSGNIYRNINSGLIIIDPISDRGIYGLSSSASACIYGTSYGPWTNLDGSAAAPFAGSNSHLGIWSGDGFILALDSYTGKWYKAGSLPVALAALTDTPSSAMFDRIVVDGGTVAWVDGSAMQGIKTMGASSAWKTELDTWTDALLIAKAGSITIAICTDGVGGTATKAHVYNDNGAKAAFESVVGAIDVVVSASSISHMVIFRMTNGTVRAFTWSVFGVPVEVTLAWTTVTDVAIADGKFWALSGNALLCSAAKPAWADDSAIPATATRSTLISGGGRLGIGYG